MASWRKLFWGLLFTAVLCGFGYVVWLADQAQSPRYGKGGPVSSDEECKKGSEETFLQRTECDPVAAFTAMLVVFTAVLAAVSTVQIRFLIRADKTAAMAASAALKTAETAMLQATHMERSITEAARAAEAMEASVAVMSEANRINRDNFAVGERPWISVAVSAASDLDLTVFASNEPGEGGNLGFLHVTTAFKNHGRSPAFGVRITVVLIGSLADILPVQDEIERYMVHVSDRATGVGHTLFPSQGIEATGQVQKWSFLEGNVLGFEPRVQRAQGGRFLVGCIDYSFAQDGRGQTRFAYILAKTAPSKTIMVDVGYGIEPDDKMIPKDEIIVHPLAIGNTAR